MTDLPPTSASDQRPHRHTEHASTHSTFGHINVDFVQSGQTFRAVAKLGHMGEIRVLIVDNELLVRRALTLFLDETSDIVVVGEAKDGTEAIDAVARLHPDVVVMDIHMPVVNGIDATAHITTQWPDVRVLAVTTFGSIDSILPALRAGASGYLLKDTEPEDIVAAVRSIHSGTGVLSPAVTQRLIGSIKMSPSPQAARLAPHEEPSSREKEALDHLAMGMSNAEIARAMHVSEGTVKAHLSSLMTKWNARDRVQLLIRAAREGVVRFD